MRKFFGQVFRMNDYFDLGVRWDLCRSGSTVALVGVILPVDLSNIKSPFPSLIKPEVFVDLCVELRRLVTKLGDHADTCNFVRTDFRILES